MKHVETSEVKEKIVNAAWELFKEKGYAKTTVNDIIRAANTSKGGFYYYFSAKDELLESLYEIFDREYDRFYENMDKSLDSFTKISQLSQYVSYYIEMNISPELMSELYQAQLASMREDLFMNPNRTYIRLIRDIIEEGQKNGEIRTDFTAEELTRHINIVERGEIIEWCIKNGSFSLGYFGTKNLLLYTQFMRADEQK